VCATTVSTVPALGAAVAGIAIRGIAVGSVTTVAGVAGGSCRCCLTGTTFRAVAAGTAVANATVALTASTTVAAVTAVAAGRDVANPGSRISTDGSAELADRHDLGIERVGPALIGALVVQEITDRATVAADGGAAIVGLSLRIDRVVGLGARFGVVGILRN